MLDVSNLVQKGLAFTSYTGQENIGVTTEHPLLYIEVPTTVEHPILLTHTIMGTDSTSVRSIWTAYSDPTVSSDGSALTSTNTYVKTSPRTAEAQVYKNPTVSSNGSVLHQVIETVNRPSRGLSRYYWIDPGHSILFTVQNSIANAKSSMSVYWIEEA